MACGAPGRTPHATALDLRKTVAELDASADNLRVMVSFGGGGGGAALGSPAGILALLVIIAIVAGVYWLFNR